ncbi:MAG: nicotinate-nucleotide--dimethylbenzimidazole phosphoribosyltransferase [Betaproteobacteria bacterium HGW-Betaproteobacteria-1]|jgi:nicotinate-nucleotide--dimethylbenzimidazole phosphoribosyltransferase|nr:MAG: nicotinate-nucleotide--dimethylbenzimidazole phosphoribosyltransferase [Betaproteobacteria bacterium HGW-Betaproteobacteria-1]
MQFNITVPDNSLIHALQAKIDQKTKPLGALGRLESLALQVGLAQGSLSPQLHRPAVMVFAGDHGIVEEGVSPYPQAVTQQMVMNFLAGGAGVNVFARQHGMQVRVVDAGVNHVFAPHPQLIDAKVAMGTHNFARQAAMTAGQCKQALEAGARLAAQEVAAGSNVLVFGEMGIGNTSSAAALMAVLCDFPVHDCVGRGTGLDDAGLQHKAAVIEQAIKLHQNLDTPLKVLATFGGFEIAMMAGSMLAAAQNRCLILVDGFIATTALLVACRMQPAIMHYCVFGHCSDEAGHAALLQHLKARPLLQLGMRLGEGTGAVLAYPLLQAAVNFLNDMASFESAHVSGRAD